MKHQVHVAIQIVPITQKDHYEVIDTAIDVIDRSGVAYKVGAMETVMQGPYDKLMAVAKEAMEACLTAGVEGIAVNLKVHAKQSEDVNWEEKKLDRSRK